jgi:hypothetical protein
MKVRLEGLEIDIRAEAFGSVHHGDVVCCMQALTPNAAVSIGPNVGPFTIKKVFGVMRSADEFTYRSLIFSKLKTKRSVELSQAKDKVLVEQNPVNKGSIHFDLAASMLIFDFAEYRDILPDLGNGIKIKVACSKLDTPGPPLSMPGPSFWKSKY